jgi:hypothetical protein
MVLEFVKDEDKGAVPEWIGRLKRLISDFSSVIAFRSRRTINR